MAPGDDNSNNNRPFFNGLPPPYGPRDKGPPAANNNQAYATHGIFMLASFVAVFAVVLFLFLICVYAGFRRRQYRGNFLRSGRNISWRRGFSFAHEDHLSLRNVGLDARVIETLPVFEYKAQSFKDTLECAVCLSEFDENEKGRLLPNCKHRFHVDCIDMWFHSHSTCPICRTGAQPKQRADNNNADEIFIDAELISSGNGEIRIGPGLEQGETSCEKAKSAVDEGPSTSGMSSLPETAIDRAGSFSSEKQVLLHSGSQSSKTAIHSLRRMLSRGREGRIFPNSLQDQGIETEGQSQSQTLC